MSLPDLDILEVKSVSDMISVFETPADDAAKLIGEDDVAIFSPQLDLMIVTSQYDLEEPVTTSQTVILSVADAECTWPDPPEYVSDIVFECRWPSGANLVTEFQTFSDENATPSASLEYYRKRFAEGGTCMVFSEYDEAYLLDLPLGLYQDAVPAILARCEDVAVAIEDGTEHRGGRRVETVYGRRLVIENRRRVHRPP